MLTANEVQRIRALDNDALRIELGRAVLKQKQSGLQARPPSIKKLLAEANAWIKSEHAQLQEAVCANDEVRTLVTSEPGMSEKLLRVVADIVGSLFAFVPAGTVAEILIRDGIPKYCQTIWEPISDS